MASPRPPSQLRQLAASRDLGLLLAASLVSQTGDWMLAVGIGFQIYVLTGSTLASATVLLVTQIPQVALGSVAGVLVDRRDRRRVMVLANLLASLVVLPLIAVREADQVWIVYLVVAASSCLSPFFVSAEASLLPALVEHPHLLVTANAVNAQVRNVARLVGAALGGVLVAGGGLAMLAVADAASFGLAALLIVLVRHRAAPSRGERPRLVRDWVTGLSAIRRTRSLRVIVFFFAVSGVGEAVMGTLFAPFVHDVLGGTARTFGTVLAAQAVGGIVGGVLVTVLGHRIRPRTLFGGGAVVFGLLDLALFLYPLLGRPTWPAVVLIALVGLPAAALSAGMLTVFQLAVDDELRGRVFGALLTVQNAAMLSSTLVAGVLARSAGIIPVIAVQGAVYILAGVVVLGVLRSRG